MCTFLYQHNLKGFLICIIRSWEARRVVYTKKIIALCNANDDDILDIIPLREIIVIRDMSNLDAIADDASQFNDGSVENGETEANILQIETQADGYNSGRPYQIQAKTGQDFRALMEDLVKLSTLAREEAEAKSRFKKLRDRVGRVYNSNASQRFFAFMIVAVSAMPYGLANLNCSTITFFEVPLIVGGT